MWYRLYLAKMPRKEYEEMIKLSYDGFMKKYCTDGDDDEYKYVWLYEITEELYWFWKYVDYSSKMEKVVFDDDNLNSRYSEYSFHIVNKEIIKDVIQEYRENVVKFYKWLLDWTASIRLWWFEVWESKKTPEERIADIEQHLNSRVMEYSSNRSINIEEWPVTTSREYEYTIFELIRIYREFDEDKDIMLYYWY